VGRRGPPPTPRAMRVLRGNPGKRPLHDGEPQPPRGRPSCPAWLDREAKAEWRRTVPLLDAMGIIAKVDRAALAAYCSIWSQWRDAEEKLRKFGPLLKPTASGYIAQSPLVALARSSLEAMRQFMREFGLTPASRTRLQVLPQSNEPDEFERLFRG